MGSHDGAIRDNPFEIRVGGEMRKQRVPNPARFPAGEPFVDAIPVAQVRREQAPGGPAPSDPENGLDKATSLEFIPDIQAGTSLEERIQAFPDVIR